MKIPSFSDVQSHVQRAISSISSIASQFAAKLQKKDVEESQNRSVVGLDIGRAYLNVVQILKAENKVTLQKYAHHQILPNIPISAQLKNVFQESQITEKRVRVSLKGQGVILRFIAFPKMTRAEFESAIQYEAEKYLPFAMSEVVLDFHIIEDEKTTGKMMDVILVAARKQEVMKIVKTIQDAELEPESIDVDALAFTNTFAYAMSEAKDKVFALIDFGAKDVNLNIMDRGTLRFSRDITFGGYDITQFLKRRLQIDDQLAVRVQSGEMLDKTEYAAALRESFGALIQEIKLSINYFYAQHSEVDPLAGIYVSGGLAKVELLKQTISQEVKLPVFEWNPIELFQIAPEIKKENLVKNKLYLPVCIGLALK